MVLYAAGNEGAKGSRTISSQAQSKNAIIVGASLQPNVVGSLKEK